MTSVILPMAADIAQQQPSAVSPAATGSATPGLFQTILLVLACVAVIVAAFYTTRLIARKAGASARSRHMEVLDRLSISNDKQILLIRAGKKVHMVGVAGSAINHLATLDEEEASAFQATEPVASREMPKVMGDFAARLKASMPFGSNDTKQDTDDTPNTIEPKKAKEQKRTKEEEEAKGKTKEAPVKSGLDTLDDMVNRRRKRFGQLEQGQQPAEQPTTAEQPPLAEQPKAATAGENGGDQP